MAQQSQERRPIMHRTLEAIVDEHGNIRLLETVALPTGRRVLVTILEEEHILPIDEVTLLSEAALAEDWNRPEEMPRGHTYRGRRSLGAVSLFRFIPGQVAPGDRPGRCRPGRLDSVPDHQHALW